MKKIGIVGSRRRHSHADYVKLLRMFDEWYDEGDQIVSGGCPTGADSFAERIAKDRGLSITIHYPDWKRYPRAAGFVRNSKIVEDSDIILALVAADRKGGTEDTITKAEKARVPVEIG
jgi:hypothetical protein